MAAPGAGALAAVLLGRAPGKGSGMAAARPVLLEVGGVVVAGDLTVPPGAHGVVAFAHGSGSSRRSPRNRAVAASLQERGLATLLLDLLTTGEEEVDRASGHLRFDVAMLAGRLGGAIRWLGEEGATAGRPVGLFGASTGAAAALVAAAGDPGSVGAVVSRGGRPDLAGPALGEVRAPTLLVVGGADEVVLDLNRQALDRLGGERELAVVAGASHLFEEPGALEQVAALAGAWFAHHLGPGG